MDTKITDNLLDNYFNKQKKNNKELQVNITTRSSTATTPAVKYFSDTEHSEVEDDRASDLSYNPESEYTDREDTTSEDETSGQTYAPLNKCLKPSPLRSSLNLPNDQTHPIPEPYSSTSHPEPYSSTSHPEPYSSHLTEKNSSPFNPEPYSSPSNPEPYSSPSNPEPYSSDSDPNNKITEPYSPDIIQDDKTVDMPDLPILSQGNNIQTLKDQTKADPTLRIIRGLAHHNKNGYVWDNGLLFHMTLDHTLGERKRLVIPKSQRQPLIQMAHDRSGHFSVAKTRSILNNRFTWPGMSTDVRTYIMSCIRCKKFNKHTHKPAPYHPRPVITEPYDEIALDIIGPLPRSRQGYRFALTAICMASRWPEVYPLKDTSAESIVSGLVEFLARNGIPSKILTNQGSQFTSGAMAQTCQLLGITHIMTVPYRPQGNGILERFHGTLKPLLAKAASSGVDWTQFLPLALSAIRAIPCRSTGFSPAELVFGRNNRGILDVVYEGWTNTSYSPIDVSAWVQQLNDKLNIIRDSATLTNTIARQKQNSHSRNSRSTRVYKPDDLVFVRIPGCRANLQASWEGPFRITKSIPPLNYEIQDMDNTWSKTTHINNLRTYKPLPMPKPLQVQSAYLVA